MRKKMYNYFIKLRKFIKKWKCETLNVRECLSASEPDNNH